MKIKYGTKDYQIDVTDICLNNLNRENIILPYLVKSILEHYILQILFLENLNLYHRNKQ